MLGLNKKSIKLSCMLINNENKKLLNIILYVHINVTRFVKFASFFFLRSIVKEEFTFNLLNISVYKYM